MKRNEMIARIEGIREKWDFIVIGGGATGMGIAVDAASRGYKVVLLEQGDFGHGTSSRSTKLVHGGVRYLQQGNISLVLEALKERGLLLENAPHLVHNLPFIVPSYDWWEAPFYGIGLKLYDFLAGKHGFGDSKLLSVEKTLEHIPTVETKGLNGGVIYYDGQFDDARLIIHLAATAAEQGATLINYMKVTRLTKTNDMVAGVVAYDVLGDREYELHARVVINATGVFSENIQQMDEHSPRLRIKPSQGVHIVLDQSFLPGDSAIMVPHTDDGRVLFAIPWHGKVLVGTTDTPMNEILEEPVPLPEEIDFILKHAARYLRKDPTRDDILSAFAGLRPLVSFGDTENTAAISRDHTIHISPSGLVTIAGGKWTTYRRMAQDTVDQAELLAHFSPRPAITQHLQIHGFHKHSKQFGELSVYGGDAPAIMDIMKRDSSLAECLHPDIPITGAQVVWAVEHEMACQLDDVLSRRTRALLLNARASMEIAPNVARIMAEAMMKKRGWIKDQVRQYNQLATKYLG